MGDTQGEKKTGAGSVININRRRRRWLRVPVADREALQGQILVSQRTMLQANPDHSKQ